MKRLESLIILSHLGTRKQKGLRQDGEKANDIKTWYKVVERYRKTPTPLSVLLLFTTSDYLFRIFKLLAIVISVLLLFTTSDYLFRIFKLLAIGMTVLLLFTTADYLWYLQTFCHCNVCPSIYDFWFSLWYFQTFKSFLITFEGSLIKKIVC